MAKKQIFITIALVTNLTSLIVASDHLKKENNPIIEKLNDLNTEIILLYHGWQDDEGPFMTDAQRTKLLQLTNERIMQKKLSIEEIVATDKKWLDKSNIYKQTPLMIATSFAFPTIVEYLLAQGANSRAHDNKGKRAIDYIYIPAWLKRTCGVHLNAFDTYLSLNDNPEKKCETLLKNLLHEDEKNAYEKSKESSCVIN